jgi:hypothetical protein
MIEVIMLVVFIITMGTLRMVTSTLRTGKDKVYSTYRYHVIAREDRKAGTTSWSENK